MESGNSNNTLQKMPLGIGLIMIVLIFITLLSLFNIFYEIYLFGFADFDILGFLRGLSVPACSALIAFGFWKRLNWSRMLFICMTAFLSIKAFINMIPIVNDPKLLDRYSGSDKITASNFLIESQLFYIIFFAGLIIWVYRKKSYFIETPEAERKAVQRRYPVA